MRLAARVDANQEEIVEGLRKYGCTVISLAKIGDGCPDLLVGLRGVNYLMEVKTKDGKLNIEQSAWHEGWRGRVSVVRSLNDALFIVGLSK